MDKKIFTTGWEDYELIDAGGGKKLERWGSVITIRPEVQAYFHSGLPFSEWEQKAHWEYKATGKQSGKWKNLRRAPEEWTISYKSLTFQLELTKFKHLGLFPEQKLNWDLAFDKLDSDSKFLNLFAYTGAMSCVARSKGAETFHVDSVKQLINWASINMELSKLLNIKWVHEDAVKFISRLEKRGEKFDFIVMDPPAWGIGRKNEKWRLEDKLDQLLGSAANILSKDGVLVLNTYSPKVDIEFLEELAPLYFSDRNYAVNELWMKTTSQKELFYGVLLRVGI